MKKSWKPFWDSEKEQVKWWNIVITVVVIGLVLLLTLPNIMFVDQGQTVVVTSGGAVVRVVGPGMHIKWPIVEAWHPFNTRQTIYQTTETADNKADFNDVPVDCNTSDGQQITVTYSITFHVAQKSAQIVYGQVGSDMSQVMENVVKFYSRSYVRHAMQMYEAKQIYSGDLLAIETNIEDQLKLDFAANNVVLDALVLRKPTFSTEYVSAIEQQQIAQQNIQTEAYKASAAENTAKQTVNLAQGTADAAVISAQGEAKAIKLKADATSYAIEQQGLMLEKYPQMLQWHFIDQLNTSKWMILPNSGAMPLLQMPDMTTPTSTTP
jgi:regulator of protease activity HflC (stomatin/prohibitin superfamily)